MKTIYPTYLAFRGSPLVPGSATNQPRERQQAFREEEKMQSESAKTPTGPRQPLKEKLGPAMTRAVTNVRKWARLKRTNKTGE